LRRKELSKSVDADLLKITPKQLECLRLLEGEEKHLSDVPEDVQPTLRKLVDRGLVEKRVAEEETKRKVYGKKHIYTITEKGLKAYKALKTIQAL
jgi:DNA-binding PadR family transcriptional regulator